MRELKHAPLKTNVGETRSILLTDHPTHLIVVRTHLDTREAALNSDLQGSKYCEELALSASNIRVPLCELFEDWSAAIPAEPPLNDDSDPSDSSPLVVRGVHS